jgi:hypothetical protein
LFTILTAPWWEPGTPNTLDIGDISAILMFLIALTAAFFGVTRFWLKLLRKIIREEVGEATRPIHPSANGGLSLADVARKTNVLEKQLNTLVEAQSETKDLLIKVLAQSVVIPDTIPKEEPALRPKRAKKST